MSGNSTRLGVGLATGHVEAAVTVLSIVALFVTGVVIGALLARRVEGGTGARPCWPWRPGC